MIFFSEFIVHNFNEGISTARFSDIFKSEEVKSIFKKKSRVDKESFRPVSRLPVLSKIFERLIFQQLIMFYEPVFPKYHSIADFRKVIVDKTV